VQRHKVTGPSAFLEKEKRNATATATSHRHTPEQQTEQIVSSWMQIIK